MGSGVLYVVGGIFSGVVFILLSLVLFSYSRSSTIVGSRVINAGRSRDRFLALGSNIRMRGGNSGCVFNKSVVLSSRRLGGLGRAKSVMKGIARPLTESLSMGPLAGVPLGVSGLVDAEGLKDTSGNLWLVNCNRVCV